MLRRAFAAADRKSARWPRSQSLDPETAEGVPGQLNKTRAKAARSTMPQPSPHLNNCPVIIAEVNLQSNTLANSSQVDTERRTRRNRVRRASGCWGSRKSKSFLSDNYCIC
ncbi:hypothetical protein NDU88_002720 [Pleurodeles waltl]|uniref:Uncharacterized protein n=1 Tax=Pleurodeles waltl TaxID=8319 RepID=A0AAV7QDH9_PLEWA|nr:hypothetical protein NDU88_002720 [Pleurodeles waltl]